jgi:hypothetical protein
MHTERHAMKTFYTGLFTAVMIVYTMYRAFTTLVILPFTGPLKSSTGIYSFVIVMAAAGITALSFTRQKGMAASLAFALSLISLAYWWVVICRATTPIWSDFYWLVVPESCFALAGVCKWLVSRPGSVAA